MARRWRDAGRRSRVCAGPGRRPPQREAGPAQPARPGQPAPRPGPQPRPPAPQPFPQGAKIAYVVLQRIANESAEGKARDQQDPGAAAEEGRRAERQEQAAAGPAAEAREGRRRDERDRAGRPAEAGRAASRSKSSASRRTRRQESRSCRSSCSSSSSSGSSRSCAGRRRRRACTSSSTVPTPAWCGPIRARHFRRSDQEARLDAEGTKPPAPKPPHASPVEPSIARAGECRAPADLCCARRRTMRHCRLSCTGLCHPSPLPSTASLPLSLAARRRRRRARAGPPDRRGQERHRQRDFFQGHFPGHAADARRC